MRNSWEKRRDAIVAKAQEDEEAICLEIWNQLVVPYCKKTRRQFLAGNGTWSFFDEKGESFNVDGKLPKRLVKALEIDSAVDERWPLGCRMPCYTPEGFEEKS